MLREHECQQAGSTSGPEAVDFLRDLEAHLDVFAVKGKELFFYSEEFVELARLTASAQMFAIRGIPVGCCELSAKVFIEKEIVPVLSVKVLYVCQTKRF